MKKHAAIGTELSTRVLADVHGGRYYPYFPSMNLPYYVGRGAVEVGKAVGRAASSVGRAVSNAASTVGDAVSGAAKGAWNAVTSLF